MQDRWERMLGRMEGWIAAAGEVAVIGRNDPTNTVEDVLAPAATQMLDDLTSLLAETRDWLAPGAREAAEELLEQRTGRGQGRSLSAATKSAARMRMFLGTFRYHLTNREAEWTCSVERAFLHLNRLLVADDDVRRRWTETVGLHGERGAEMLGGCHLLQHGIWAFKAHATGERTDLVLSTTLSFTERERRAADALVLTEWKLANSEKEVDRKVAEAFEQARLYSRGALAGFELRSVRYLVTVGADRCATRAEFRDGPVSYQHFHVAIAPKPPSRDAVPAARAGRAKARRETGM